MLGDAYTLEYLPLFDEELAEAVRCITDELRNPDAAMKLVADAEVAIQDRLFAPESFEPVPSERTRTSVLSYSSRQLRCSLCCHRDSHGSSAFRL